MPTLYLSLGQVEVEQGLAWQRKALTLPGALWGQHGMSPALGPWPPLPFPAHLSQRSQHTAVVQQLFIEHEPYSSFSSPWVMM